MIKMTSHNQGAVKAPWLTLGLAVVFVILYLMNNLLFQAWVFDKPAVLQGEWWRLITGHLVHCRFDHLFWDLAAFGILGTVIEFNSRRHLIPSLLISCALVSAWLLWGQAPYPTYCGLSGALNGMLVVASLLMLSSTGNRMYLLVMLLTMGKTVFEFTTHQTIFTGLALQAAPGAHAVGFAAGLAYWLIMRGRQPIGAVGRERK